MAQMCGSAVRRWASTTTKPCLSIWTLVFSRPRPSLLGRRPTETSTRLNCWTLRSTLPSKVTSIACALFDQGHDLHAQQDLGEILAQLLVQRADQVAVGAGQQAVGQFHDGDARAQGRVDRPHFQADVTAADDQQRLGHVGQFQRRRWSPSPAAWAGRRPESGRAANRWPGCSSRSGCGRRPAGRVAAGLQAAASARLRKRPLAWTSLHACAWRRLASGRR